MTFKQRFMKIEKCRPSVRRHPPIRTRMKRDNGKADECDATQAKETIFYQLFPSPPPPPPPIDNVE